MSLDAAALEKAIVSLAAVGFDVAAARVSLTELQMKVGGFIL